MPLIVQVAEIMRIWTNFLWREYIALTISLLFFLLKALHSDDLGQTYQVFLWTIEKKAYFGHWQFSLRGSY